jgi:hypothetical protein
VTISKFAGEDDALREWIGKKPKGYVLNTRRDYPDRDNTRLHRASCFTPEPGFGGRAVLTGEQIKLADPTLSSSTSGRSGIWRSGGGGCVASTASPRPSDSLGDAAGHRGAGARDAADQSVRSAARRRAGTRLGLVVDFLGSNYGW